MIETNFNIPRAEEWAKARELEQKAYAKRAKRAQAWEAVKSIFELCFVGFVMLCYFSFWATIAYVIFHFIQKFW